MLIFAPSIFMQMKKSLFLIALAISMIACGQQDDKNDSATPQESKRVIVPQGVPTAPVPREQAVSTPEGNLIMDPDYQAPDPNAPVLKLEEGKPLDLSQLAGGQKRSLGEMATEMIDSIQKIAESGDAEYQYFYGACFNEGWGVDVDMEEALKWYKKAAAGNQKFSFNAIGNIYRTGSGIKADPKQAFEWFARGAEAKDPQAMLNYGNCYYYGMGTAKSLDQAVKWWTDAATYGNAFAEAQLGDCYFYGMGVEKSLSKAVEYLSRAAEKDIAGAQYRLGILYYAGQGVEQDLTHSELLMKKARDGGMKEAQDFLDKQFKK